MTQTANETEIKARVLDRLLQHLDARSDVQNIDLMILAGFCRNCLSNWYQDAAAALGQPVDKDRARERIYGRPYADWKAAHQKPASAEQLAKFKALSGD